MININEVVDAFTGNDRSECQILINTLVLKREDISPDIIHKWSGQTPVPVGQRTELIRLLLTNSRARNMVADKMQKRLNNVPPF